MNIAIEMMTNMLILIPFGLFVTWFIFWQLPSILSAINFFVIVDQLMDVLAFGWYDGGKAGRVLVAIVFAAATFILLYSGLRLVGAGHNGAAAAAVIGSFLLPMAAALWP